MWSAPSPDERAALLAEHAHRYPVPVPIVVRGDRGEHVRLPFLLGNPSGALRAPTGRVSPAMSQIVGVVTLGKDEGDDDELIRDCVLYPPPAQFKMARDRWPAIVGELSRQIAIKVGLASTGPEVFAGEEVPAEIAAALEAHPRATCRRFSPPGRDGGPRDVLLVIDTPTRTAYDLFTDVMQERGADRVRLVREFAEVVAVSAHGGTPAAIFDEWPGVLVLAVGVALKLASTIEGARLGEW